MFHVHHVQFGTMRMVLGLLIAMLAALFQSATSDEADAILAQLSKISLDKKQIFNVRDITLRRDALTITLDRGVIAFLEPVRDKVTGAVFLGSGEIVTLPPDAIEKSQVFKFTGTPILNEPFDTAVFRFTDGTYEEIRKEIAEHAQEDVSAEDAAKFDPWDMLLAERSITLNNRLLEDFLEGPSRPLFLGQLHGEKRGWFNVAFDPRAVEEVSVFQLRDIGGTVVGDIWASFNQRSEARNPESVAHEDKSPIEILSYDIDAMPAANNMITATAVVRSKARISGARVLSFDLAPNLHVSGVTTSSEEKVPCYQNPNSTNFIVVLPQALRADQELTLRFTYSGETSANDPWFPSQRQQTIPSFKSNIALPPELPGTVLEYSGRKIAPASYHDAWLMEGIRGYTAVMSGDATKALSDARDELKLLDMAGPISLGQRLASTVTPSGYRAVGAKSLWVLHMLRTILLDTKFLALIQEFADTYNGKSASTWDFKRIAEKHAGKKLDWFFDEWVFGTGIPAYSLDYKVEAAGAEFTVDGTITQTGVPDGFTMPVPLYADTQFLGNVQVGDGDGQFRFRVNKKPDQVLIDPEMTILTLNAPR